MFLEPTNVHLILFIEKKGISLLNLIYKFIPVIKHMYGNF